MLDPNPNPNPDPNHNPNLSSDIAKLESAQGMLICFKTILVMSFYDLLTIQSLNCWWEAAVYGKLFQLELDQKMLICF
jgi:hypothetical protein